MKDTKKQDTPEVKDTQPTIIEKIEILGKLMEGSIFTQEGTDEYMSAIIDNKKNRKEIEEKIMELVRKL